MTEPVGVFAPTGRWLGSALRISLSGHELEGRPELLEYVEQRLFSTLGHLTRAIECVAVRGKRVDQGPFEGAFRCQIVARLVRGRDVAEEETGGDVYSAIDRAAEALARDVEYLEWRLPPGEALRCA